MAGSGAGESVADDSRAADSEAVDCPTWDSLVGDAEGLGRGGMEVTGTGAGEVGGAVVGKLGASGGVFGGLCVHAVRPQTRTSSMETL